MNREQAIRIQKYCLDADVTESGVLKALDGRLAKFKMPKRVFVVDELPRNAMGKVQKNILRDTYAKIYAK